MLLLIFSVWTLCICVWKITKQSVSPLHWFLWLKWGSQGEKHENKKVKNRVCGEARLEKKWMRNNLERKCIPEEKMKEREWICVGAEKRMEVKFTEWSENERYCAEGFQPDFDQSYSRWLIEK